MCNDATPSYTAAEMDALLDYACAYLPNLSDEERHSNCPGVNLHLDVCSEARQEWECLRLDLDISSEISAGGHESATELEWQENQHKLGAARGMRRLPPDLLPELRRATAALDEIRREPVAALLARIAREATQAAASATAAAQAAATAAQPTPADPQSAALGIATICIAPRIVAQRPFAARVQRGHAALT